MVPRKFLYFSFLEIFDHIFLFFILILKTLFFFQVAELFMDHIPGLGDGAASDTRENLCALNLVSYMPDLILADILPPFSAIDGIDNGLIDSVTDRHAPARMASFKTIMANLKSTLASISEARRETVSGEGEGEDASGNHHVNFFQTIRQLEKARRKGYFAEELDYLVDYALANIESKFTKKIGGEEEESVNPMYGVLRRVDLQFNFAQRFSAPGERLDSHTHQNHVDSHTHHVDQGDSSGRKHVNNTGSQHVNSLVAHVFNVTRQLWADHPMAEAETAATVNLAMIGDTDIEEQFLVLHRSRHCSADITALYTNYTLFCKT